MKLLLLVWSTLFTALLTNVACAEVVVRCQQSQETSFFQFDSIPLPAIDDAAASGKWRVVRGKPDNNSAPLSVINDGKIPSDEDSPRENFFFAPGTAGGCIAVDLGRAIEIAQVATYSWHPASRAPQVYTLYGADDSDPNFSWDQLAENQNPDQAGWKTIAQVDSRTDELPGGQHAALIIDSTGAIGKYRYLLFEIDQTANDDPFANTFFSEIDVVEIQAAEPKRIIAPELKTIRFSTTDEAYHFTVDLTAVPELEQWSQSVLKPTVQQWYPKIVAMLPSEGYVAPSAVRFRFLPGEKMEGVPAYARGATISLNASWFNREQDREAAGAVVHEMVHVVQAYQSGRRRGKDRQSPPGWIVEGIPDYIRWFLYEPQSQGAVLSRAALANAKHDASYRVSANFIDWVLRTHDGGGTLLQQLNADARQGRYSSETWKRLTGTTELELADQWRNQ